MEIYQVEVGLLAENIDSNNSSDTNENDKSRKTKAEDKEVKFKKKSFNDFIKYQINRCYCTNI